MSITGVIANTLPSTKLSPTLRNDADLLTATGTAEDTWSIYWGLTSQYNTPRTHNGKVTAGNTSFQLFPLSKFKYFLTLFSKFFSSFPHGTCSLSVSRRYLALDEIYHPLRTALPSNPTLWAYVESNELSISDGIVTLSDNLFQGTCIDVTADSMSRDYNSQYIAILRF